MGDTFLRTLHSVVSGARQVEDFCHVLAGSVVEDTLLCVARDYGHDYRELVRKYRADVLRRHAGGTSVDAAKCRGASKAGKPCPKRAVLHGYCQQHAVNMAAEETKRRKVQAYAASIPRNADDARVRVVAVLCDEPPQRSDDYLVTPALGDFDL